MTTCANDTMPARNGHAIRRSLRSYVSLVTCGIFLSATLGAGCSQAVSPDRRETSQADTVLIDASQNLTEEFGIATYEIAPGDFGSMETFALDTEGIEIARLNVDESDGNRVSITTDGEDHVMVTSMVESPSEWTISGSVDGDPLVLRINRESFEVSFDEEAGRAAASARWVMMASAIVQDVGTDSGAPRRAPGDGTAGPGGIKPYWSAWWCVGCFATIAGIMAAVYLAAPYVAPFFTGLAAEWSLAYAAAIAAGLTPTTAGQVAFSAATTYLTGAGFTTGMAQLAVTALAGLLSGIFYACIRCFQSNFQNSNVDRTFTLDFQRYGSALSH